MAGSCSMCRCASRWLMPRVQLSKTGCSPSQGNTHRLVYRCMLAHMCAYFYASPHTNVHTYGCTRHACTLACAYARCMSAGRQPHADWLPHLTPKPHRCPFAPNSQPHNPFFLCLPHNPPVQPPCLPHNPIQSMAPAFLTEGHFFIWLDSEA